MSAIKAVYEAALADLHNAAAKLEQIGHDGWERVKQIAHELEGDEPVLAADAEKDAADVVHTAATEGVIPAEHKAIEDAGELAGEVVGDVKTAVQDAAHSPQQTATILAGETAVASTDTHA